MLRSLLLSALLVVGCNRTPEPDPGARPVEEAKSAASPTPPHPHAATSSASDAPIEIGWDAPASFEKSETTSPMRKATYKVKRAAGDDEDGDLSVSQVGGGIDANVKRWAGQFGDAKPVQTKKTVNGIGVTLVEIKGTYAGMSMPGQPGGGSKPKYELLGAIVETKVPTFFKLVGPEKTVSAAKADFDKLVDSIKAK